MLPECSGVLDEERTMGERLRLPDIPQCFVGLFELTTEPFGCQTDGFQSKVEAKKPI